MHSARRHNEECPRIMLHLFCMLFWGAGGLFIISFTFQLNSQEVLPSAIFWTSRGHRCHAFSPPVRVFIFISRIGFSIPTARRFSSNVASSRFPLIIFYARKSMCVNNNRAPPVIVVYTSKYQAYLIRCKSIRSSGKDQPSPR